MLLSIIIYDIRKLKIHLLRVTKVRNKIKKNVTNRSSIDLKMTVFCRRVTNLCNFKRGLTKQYLNNGIHHLCG